MDYQATSLNMIRIACHHNDCHAITEIGVNQVEGVMKKTNASCPVCGRPFTSQSVEGGADVVTMFARAVLALRQLGGQVGVELRDVVGR